LAKPVTLSNGRSWRTRKAAIEFFRAMLGRYADGERITDPQDHDDLRSLLELYDSVVPPGAVTKSGTGIQYFSRQLNSAEGYSTSGFHVHRSDGTAIDFSFYRAVETSSDQGKT
jgi:hypothetical protein